MTQQYDTSRIEIFSDCASYHNGKPDQIGGFCTLVLDANDNIMDTIIRCYDKTTNNYNELLGVLVGITHVLQKYPECMHVTVTSDSEYVVKGANERVAKWKNQGWKNTSGAVKNVELWKIMVEGKADYAKARKILKFEWVKGHKGKNITYEEDRVAYFQEKCDTLATEALKKVVDYRNSQEEEQ